MRGSRAFYSSGMKRKCVCVCAGSEIRWAIASKAVQCRAAGRAQTGGARPGAPIDARKRGWVVRWMGREGTIRPSPARLKGRGHTESAENRRDRHAMQWLVRSTADQARYGTVGWGGSKKRGGGTGAVAALATRQPGRGKGRCGAVRCGGSGSMPWGDDGVVAGAFLRRNVGRVGGAMQ